MKTTEKIKTPHVVLERIEAPRTVTPTVKPKTISPLLSLLGLGAFGYGLSTLLSEKPVKELALEKEPKEMYDIHMLNVHEPKITKGKYNTTEFSINEINFFLNCTIKIRDNKFYFQLSKGKGFETLSYEEFQEYVHSLKHL